MKLFVQTLVATKPAAHVASDGKVHLYLTGDATFIEMTSDEAYAMAQNLARAALAAADQREVA